MGFNLIYLNGTIFLQKKGILNCIVVSKQIRKKVTRGDPGWGLLMEHPGKE